MNYTCAYWRNAQDLDTAQINKMELIAQKLKLTPGMRVLDLGCGYGSTSKYLAERYDVSVVGCNISKEQVKYARESCRHLAQAEFLLCDYRALDFPPKSFDRVICIGMMEHVGRKNYDGLFKQVRHYLKDDGIFLVHTIGLSDKDFPDADPFMHKYIFPNAMCPFPNHMARAVNCRFVIEVMVHFKGDLAG